MAAQDPLVGERKKDRESSIFLFAHSFNGGGKNSAQLEGRAKKQFLMIGDRKEYIRERSTDLVLSSSRKGKKKRKKWEGTRKVYLARTGGHNHVERAENIPHHLLEEKEGPTKKLPRRRRSQNIGGGWCGYIQHSAPRGALDSGRIRKKRYWLSTSGVEPTANQGPSGKKKVARGAFSSVDMGSNRKGTQR